MTGKKTSLSLSTLLVLALTAVVPLAVATGFSNFERPRQLVLALMAALALASWGVDVVRGKGPQIASVGTLALGGAFFAVVIASLTWSNLWEFGALSVVSWTALAVVFLVLVAPVGRRATFLDWTTAVGAGAIGAGGMGLYEFFTSTSIHPVWDVAGVTGGFDAMAFAAAYYVLVVPLLAAAVSLSSGARRWFMALALLVAMVHLGLVIDPLMLGTLVGAMAIAALLVALVGKSPQLGRRAALTAVGSALIVAVALAGYLGFDRPETENVAIDLPRVTMSPESLEEMARQQRPTWWFFRADRMEAPVDYRYRSYLNSVTRGLWDKEPVIGHGAGGWALMQTDVVDDSDPVVNQIFDRYPSFASPHSDYARISVEQGGLGLILFLLWLAGILTALVRGVRARSESATEDEEFSIVTWALATAVISGMAMMAFVPVLELISSAVIWMGAAALAVGYAATHSRDSQWLNTYDAAGSSMAVRAPVALLAFCIAVALVVPSAQHGQAAMERAHADNLMMEGRFNKAIPLYTAAHEAYPAHGEVLYNAAIAYYMMGQSEQAWELMHEALEMRPYDALLLTHSARLAIRTGRVDTAKEKSREAVRTAPNYVEAYGVYGAALQRRARYLSAAELFAAYLDRNPPIDQRGPMRINYATILSKQLDMPKEALEQYEIALDELPAGPERMLIHDRIEAVEAQIERERLEAAGKPVPPGLRPEAFEHHHDHGHGHGLDHGFGPEIDIGHDHDHDHEHPEVPGEFGPDPMHHLESH